MHHKLAFTLRDARTSGELASVTRTVGEPTMRVPLSRVTLLAVLVYVVPAVYLLEVWPRKAPPAPEEVNHAPIAIKNGTYHVSLPNGLVYEVSDPTAGVAGGSDKARNAVRSRIAGERSSIQAVMGPVLVLTRGHVWSGSASDLDPRSGQISE